MIGRFFRDSLFFMPAEPLKDGMSGDSLFMVKTKECISAILFPEVGEMDPQAIGSFIAQLRKQQGLTQEKFGEQIGVTNKTVSRWETGNYMPPADILLKMSGMFNVTVNEILCGKRLTAEEYKDAAEENLKEAVRTGSFHVKERMEFFKKKWLKDHIAIMVFIGICIACVLAAGIVMNKTVICLLALFLLVIAHGWRNNTMMAYAEHKIYDDPEESGGVR